MSHSYSLQTSITHAGTKSSDGSAYCRRKGSGGSRRASTRPVLPDFDEPADGSGSRRRAPVAEVESPSGRPSNW